MYNSTNAFLVILCSTIINLMHVPDVVAEQDTVIYFDFDDGSGGFENMPDTLVVGLQADGWLDRFATLTDFAGDPGRALAAREFDTDNAFVLELVVQPGYVLGLESFSFDQMASSSGPQQWSLSVNDAFIAEGSTSPGFTTQSGSMASPDLMGEVMITLSGSGASSNRGTLRLDNFRLTGSVQTVPLPAPLTLLLSGLLMLIRRP